MRIKTVTVCFLVFGVLGLGVSLADQRPNIVLLLADDLGWTGVGCYGSDFYETPNIDRLAEQGMRFDNAYANMKNCAPSRASIMSGQYVGRHRVLYVGSYESKWKQRNGGLKRFPLLEASAEKHLPNDTLTIAESLKKAGYATAMFGKWHLGMGDQHPGKRGFDVAIESHGKHFNFTTDPPVEHDPAQYLSDLLAERAGAFIRSSHDAKKPFFLYFPDFLVHGPLEAKPAYLDRFEKKKPGKHQGSPGAGAMIKSLDDSVGRILDVLDDLKITDKTVVVFMSDNGGLAYEEDGKRPNNTSNIPLRGQKGSEYDGGLRVPFIIRWPGRVPAGTCNHEAVTGADLYPTFLALAGAPGPTHKLDGASLLQILRNPDARLPHRVLFWHMPSYSSFHRPCIVARQGDWKLIKVFDSGERELYDTGKDVGEMTNIASRHPELVNTLDTAVEKWLKDANAPRMKPNPQHEPGWKPSRGSKTKGGVQ